MAQGNDIPHRGNPQVIGHRGAAGLAPENTLEGFRLARDIGVTWVEFDVMLTSDRVPVLIHDDNLDRTTSGTGAVARHTWAEISGLDAGAWFSADFEGARVPRLDEALNDLDLLGLGANVEIKPYPGEERATGEVTAAMVRDAWPGRLPPPVFSSFSDAALEAARDTAPDIARALLVEAVPQNWRRRMENLGASVLHISDAYANEAVVHAVLAQDVPVRVYTVNDADRARELWGWGVESVFTDVPDRVAPD